MTQAEVTRKISLYGYQILKEREYCRIGRDRLRTGRVFPGARSIKQRLTDISAERRNIAALWPTA